MRKLLAILAIVFPLALVSACEDGGMGEDQAGEPVGAPADDQAGAPAGEPGAPADDQAADDTWGQDDDMAGEGTDDGFES